MRDTAKVSDAFVGQAEVGFLNRVDKFNYHLDRTSNCIETVAHQC